MKARFVHLTSPATVESTVVFQYNPDTLSRRLTAVAGDGTVALPAPPREPQEIIAFRITLDIASNIDNAPSEALRDGIYSQLSAMEQLMYAPTLFPNAAVLFIWGESRILPIQLMELQIVEQMFDATLTPTLAEMAVTLRVLKQADLEGQDWASRFWREHLLKVQQLAASVSQGSLEKFGLRDL